MPGLPVPADQLVIIVMLIFSRIGTCLMFMPGFSSARVPVKLRLFLGLSLSLAMLPLIGPKLQDFSSDITLPGLLSGIASQLLIGAAFGFMAQVFLWALQFMANVIAISMGFSGQPGISVLESMPESQVANLITLAALTIFFATDMHFLLFRGLLSSYDLLPVSLFVQPQAVLVDAVDAVSGAFFTCFHIAAPFVLYAVLVNCASGLINKLTPSIPVYFISLPFVICGGLALLFFLLPEILHFFSREMASWVLGGS